MSSSYRVVEIITNVDEQYKGQMDDHKRMKELTKEMEVLQRKIGEEGSKVHKDQFGIYYDDVECKLKCRDVKYYPKY